MDINAQATQTDRQPQFLTLNEFIEARKRFGRDQHIALLERYRLDPTPPDRVMHLRTTSCPYWDIDQDAQRIYELEVVLERYANHIGLTLKIPAARAQDRTRRHSHSCLNKASC